MEQVHHIKKQYNQKEKSISEIARITGHDRKTVRKYLNQEDFSVPVPTRRARSSKSDAYRETVKQWLKDDQDAPRKQRHTARRVFHRLQEMEAKQGRTLDLSERSVRSLVRQLRVELIQSEQVSLPLYHPAGEAQIDFGETKFYERGTYFEGYHLALTLPHSNAKFVQLFKGQTFECLAQGFINIFNHMGAVPSAIWLDNMSTAVKAILAHGLREVTDRFLRMQCHFGFDSNFCNPAAGHEKGSVENYVGYSRRNYFVPVPRFDDLEEYNRKLLEQCDEELDRDHYKLEKTVRELYQEDLARMNALPRYPFDGDQYVLARTNQYGMVRHKTNSYSTGGGLARQEVTLKVGAYHVTVFDGMMKEVVTHQRLYGKNKESMIWGPYLDVLAKRPMALKYSGFFQGLPQPVRVFFDECAIPGKKQILDVVAATSREVGMDQAVHAMSDALTFAPQDPDSFIAAYSFALNRPGPIPKNQVPDYLPELRDYDLDFSAYGELMGGAACRK